MQTALEAERVAVMHMMVVVVVVVVMAAVVMLAAIVWLLSVLLSVLPSVLLVPLRSRQHNL
jgi:hypothetical protein